MRKKNVSPFLLILGFLAMIGNEFFLGIILWMLACVVAAYF